ncbi:MAG TPA: MG2 domain-containing protein [Myxococcaceae bacterium]|nr:MG2 domain-containing protein [Myxococcaceae bacterium]
MALSPIQRRVAIAGAAAAALLLYAVSPSVCLRSWIGDGIFVPVCPDGRPRQEVNVATGGWIRGKPGRVAVSVLARYTTSAADRSESTPVRRFTAALSLTGPDGKELPLQPLHGWLTSDDYTQVAQVTVPQVPDGDYRLIVKVKSPVEDATQEVIVPLYAAAKIHTLTDRPLYEPGQQVKFRALVLRARDLSPLDGRPGRFVVTDPSGETFLDELAPAGPWGVAAGSFPLDRAATAGTWTVAWRSGDASGEARFQVQPFTLPRFRVDAEPSAPFYGAGDRPVIKGEVVYSSGAPVPNAKISVEWTAGGEWPPPLEWMDALLPKRATAGTNGRFTLELPQVPTNLKKTCTLTAQISAADPAGDRVESTAEVLLSQDPIGVTAVTELGDGLVGGFNNRVYLRASSVGGGVLRGAELEIKRAWDPKDRGVKATTDEDGVAALQLDPGPPVNVIIPAMPVRVPVRKPSVSRTELRDLLMGGGGDGEGDEESPVLLSDELALDKLNEPLLRCATWAQGSASATVGLKVEPRGAISGVTTNGTPLGRCVAEVLQGRSLAAGRDRVYAASFDFDDGGRPQLAVSAEGIRRSSSPVETALQAAALGARTCLPRDARGVTLPRAIVWRTRHGSREVSLSWVPASGGRLAQDVLSCVQSRFGKVELPRTQPGEEEESEDDEEDGTPIPASASGEDMGVARLSISGAEEEEQSQPRDTVMRGYELKVSAKLNGKDLGQTRVLFQPGEVPPLRLRATPVIAQPGQEVALELIRGPGFSGALPQKLTFVAGKKRLEVPVDAKARTARFAVPNPMDGWIDVQVMGARALVYVPPRAALEVQLQPEKPRYAPGDVAQLSVRTTVDGQPGAAAVGLFGVDQSLSQLAPLPGPDAMGKLKPAATVSAPAFGVLDGEALAMGRIRGANAAAATILRVNQLPPEDVDDHPVAAQSASSFDPVGPLTDHFYVALAELHAQVRAWEEKAPEAERMTPETMARMWDRAMSECKKRGEDVTDAYGRPLRLSRLPPDLLALTDPRAVVLTGTRLSEDVENWTAWVAKEMP